MKALIGLVILALAAVGCSERGAQDLIQGTSATGLRTVDEEYSAQLDGSREADTVTTTVYLNDYDEDEISYISFYIEFYENFGGAGPGNYVYWGYERTNFSQNASVSVFIIDEDPDPIYYNYVAYVNMSFAEDPEFTDDHEPILNVFFLNTAPPDTCKNYKFLLYQFNVEDHDKNVAPPESIESTSVWDCGRH